MKVCFFTVCEQVSFGKDEAKFIKRLINGSSEEFEVWYDPTEHPRDGSSSKRGAARTYTH